MDATDNELEQQRRARLESQSHDGRNIGTVVLRTAWFAIVLGIGVEVLLLIAVAALGRLPGPRVILANLTQMVVWSTIVCVGINVAAAASDFQRGFMGLAGLLSAPLAFSVARSLQRGVSAALALPHALGGGPSQFVVGAIKAVEYGCLGALIAWILARGRRSALAHAVVGLCTGILFGGTLLAYVAMSSVTGISTLELATRGINEVVFPVGCSLVVFATKQLGNQLKSSSERRVKAA